MPINNYSNNVTKLKTDIMKLKNLLLSGIMILGLVIPTMAQSPDRKIVDDPEFLKKIQNFHTEDSII